MTSHLILDLDQTLADQGELYEGVAELLEQLATDYSLYICSLNPLAEYFLQRKGVRQYFQGVLEVPWELNKAETILKFTREYGLELSTICFFDDDLETIAEARQLGIPSVLVPMGGLQTSQIDSLKNSLCDDK